MTQTAIPLAAIQPTMRIRYESTIDDQIAVYHNQLKTSPENKKSRRMTQVSSGLFLLSGLVFGAAAGDWFFAVLMIACSALMYSSVFFMQKRTVPNLLKKMLKGENSRGAIGAHELEILPDGLIDRTEYKETKFAWALFDHIETDAEHTFLHFGRLNVIAIPRHAVTEGSLPAFIKTLGEQYRPEAKLIANVSGKAQSAPEIQ